MDRIWRQKQEKHRKDGMGRGMFQHCNRKRRVKAVLAKLKSLQIRLNRETMRMEPAE